MQQVRRAFYNYLFVVMTHVGMLAVGVVLVAFLARALGPEGYGRYNSFLLIAEALLVLTASWVLNPAAAKFGSVEFLNTGKLNKTFYAELVITGACLFVTGVFVYAFRYKLGDFLGISSGLSVMLVLSYIVFMVLFTLIRLSYQSCQDFTGYGLMPLIRSALFLIMLTFLFFGFGACTVRQVIAFFLLAHLIIFMGFGFNLKEKLALAFDRAHMVNILKFSWPMFFFAGSNFVLSWADKFFIRVLMSTHALGIYAAAWTLTAQISLIPQLFYSVALPIVSKYKVEGRQEYIQFYLTRLIPQMTIFFSVFVSCAVLCARFAIPFIYGSKYAGTTDIFVLLSISSLYVGIRYFYNPVSTVFNYIRLTGSINLASAILCLALNYIFVSRFGIKGGACATILSSFVAASGVMVVINRKFGFIDYRAVICGLPAVAIAGICIFIKDPAVVFTYVLAVCGVLFIFLKKMNIFRKEDIVFIEKIHMPEWLMGLVLRLYRVL